MLRFLIKKKENDEEKKFVMIAFVMERIKKIFLQLDLDKLYFNKIYLLYFIKKRCKYNIQTRSKKIILFEKLETTIRHTTL